MTENGNGKKPMSARKKKFLAFLAVTLATGVSTLGIYGATELYDSFFKRYERPDYKIAAGIRQLSQTNLTREEMTFLSDSVRLRGYYYPAKGQKGLVVFSHGLHAGADDYLPFFEFFVQNGYGVFAYNYKGTYESEGDGTVGMCESLVDLDHALDFVETDARFAGQGIYLAGHSWGGFATAAVLSLHPNVRAAACIAGFNSGYTLIEEKGRQYAGDLAGGVPKAFLGLYQKFLFGKYVEYDGVRGINGVTVPVVIAHGAEDAVIDYARQSLAGRRDEIVNPNVTYYVGRGAHAGHESIFLSERAAKYREEVKSALKRAKDAKEDWGYEDEVAFYAKVDDRLYSEINEELFRTIVKTFDEA